MNPTRSRPPFRWNEVWIDAAAFALGIGFAWLFNWSTTDLVWSLWLSSLVVGYAILVWSITRPLRQLAAAARHAPAGSFDSPGARAAAWSIGIVGTLFTLAFFTVHFGGFHFVHSAFLNAFFPLSDRSARGFPTWAVYAEVFRRYWWFLPAAFLAERAAFRAPAAADTSVTVGAIRMRTARPDAVFAPYRNVIRMHLLIFFFAFARAVHLASFGIYAVAYAAYFFPWRMLQRKPPVAELRPEPVDPVEETATGER